MGWERVFGYENVVYNLWKNLCLGAVFSFLRSLSFYCLFAYLLF